MAYLGNDLQVAFPTYRNIDDISSSFNGVLTSFPLTVSGVAPIPAPINSQQCLISVNGVVQRPDDSGTEGFRLSGGNIIFASAPAGGVDFFGVILAGADYVNAGANFPSGTAAVPSITFDSDLDTGVYNPAANQLGITTGGTARLIIDASGQIRANSLGSASAPVITFNSDPNTGIYSPGADQVAISTNGTGRLFVDASGRVGLGTSSPAYVLDVINANFGVSFANSMNWNYPGLILRRNASNASTIKMLSMMLNGDSESDTVLTNYLNIWGTYSGTPTTGSTTSSLSGVMNFGAPNALAFHTNTSERARIDSSGRLLVGTSTARANFFNSTISAAILLEGAGITPAQRFLSVVNNYATDGDGGGVISLCRSKGGTVGSNTLVGSASGDQLGALNFQGNDGTEFVVGARIEAYTDGTCGANDLPSRLVFSTTADGASSPTERMRITQAGNVSINTTDTGSGRLHVVTDSTTLRAFAAESSNASFTDNIIISLANRTASEFFAYFAAYNKATVDTDFTLRGDGNAFADGTWSGGGADYAEYFEWSDGNPDEEDRRGISVVLDGDRIRPAVDGEDPIGVISSNPSVVGDAAWNKWSGKYLRDDYGTYIQEDYEVVNDEGETVIQQRRKLNPDYDPDQEYVNREQRPEWDCVGLMGKLRIRKGQVTGVRWIKMRDISDSVEEWLVR